MEKECKDKKTDTITRHQRGIIVKISEDEFNYLKEHYQGFLPIDSYPEYFSFLNQEGELGRFLNFRLFKE